jgi:hypothetical protein
MYLPQNGELYLLKYLPCLDHMEEILSCVGRFYIFSKKELMSKGQQFFLWLKIVKCLPVFGRTTYRHGKKKLNKSWGFFCNVVALPPLLLSL